MPSSATSADSRPARLRSMKPIACFIIALICSIAVLARAQEIVTLSTRPGVTQSYFVARVPDNPQAIALLFPGGAGLIHLKSENGKIKFGPDNFLVRSRVEFIKRDVIAAIVDAPSELQSGGMSDEFRLGEQHFTDISATVADLYRRFPGVPLFLIGTSRGTVSAAALAGRFGTQVAGVVLTSTYFRSSSPKSKDRGPGLSRFDFASIKIPVLLVHHVSDQCGVTPYADAQRLSDKYPLISVAGGLPAKSEPCEAFSQHGYYGKELETVQEIVNWMLKKPFRSEVK